MTFRVNQTPMSKRFIARFVVEKRHQNDICYNETGLCAQNKQWAKLFTQLGRPMWSLMKKRKIIFISYVVTFVPQLAIWNLKWQFMWVTIVNKWHNSQCDLTIKIICGVENLLGLLSYSYLKTSSTNCMGTFISSHITCLESHHRIKRHNTHNKYITPQKLQIPMAQIKRTMKNIHQIAIKYLTYLVYSIRGNSITNKNPYSPRPHITKRY